MSNVIIGAHTLTGVSAKSLSERLCDAKFPLSVEISSHAPFNLSLPEAGVFLRPCESREFSVKTPDAMARMINSAEQVAELNGSAKLITIFSETLIEGAGEEEKGETAANSSGEEKGEAGANAGGDTSEPTAPATAKRTGSRKSGSKK